MSSQEFEGLGDGGVRDADEVAGYAAEVRAQFADLSEAESADLLEDLEDHLREVAAEGAGTLRERLGAPATYASELRQAAGLPEPGEGNGSGASQGPGTVPWRRALRASVRNGMKEAERLIRINPAGAAVLDFLPTLRPAWWVVRAWIVVRALQVKTTYVNTWHDFSLIPRVDYSTLVGTLCLLVAIPASVYLGRRNYSGGWPRRLMLAGQTVLVVFAAGMALSAIQDENGDGNTSAWRAAYDQVQQQPAQDGLFENGEAVSNLYVFDQNGKPLDGVYVYDQHGSPVTTAPTKEGDVPWLDGDDQLIPNRYPHESVQPQWLNGVSHYGLVPPPNVLIPQGAHQVSPPSATPSSPGAPTTPDTPQGSATPSSSPSTPASSGANGAQTSPALPSTPNSPGGKG